jgi:glycine oxidase ThiO
MKQAADVIVVGGGVIGSAVARELAIRGASVMLFERSEPAAEASGVSGGMIAPQGEFLAPGALFDLGVESRAIYPKWVEQIESETDMTVGYRRTGMIRCSTGPGAPGPDRFLWQREAALTVEVLDRAGIAERSGGQAPDATEGVFLPEEALVDSLRLTRALWAAAARHGVLLRAGVCVRRFVGEGGVCRGVEAEGGFFAARAVVNAAGAWAGFDESLPFSIPLEPVRGQILELRPEGATLQTILQSERVYLVPHADGTVLAGATSEHVGFEKRVTPSAVRDLIDSALGLAPLLESASFVRARVGLRPGTPDDLPLLGPSPVAGLYLAAGHYRSGVLLAPITAQIIADQLEGRGGRDLSPFSVERFSRTTTATPGGPTRFG